MNKKYYFTLSYTLVTLPKSMFVVLFGTKFCKFWQKRCYYTYFSSFAVILCVSVTNLSLALRFSSNSCAPHKNYGEWWKVGEIREKTVKSKKFVKITPFTSKFTKSWSPTIQQPQQPPNCNHAVCNGKYWLKTAKSGSDIW